MSENRDRGDRPRIPRQTSQIVVDLRWRKDRFEDGYLVANPDVPANIKLDEVVFLIFPHPESSEEFPQMIIKGKSIGRSDQRTDRASDAIRDNLREDRKERQCDDGEDEKD